MNKTIEQTVAETILEQPFEVKVGEKSYQVASASTATLILVSEAISQLPQIKEKRYMCGLIRRPYTVEVEITIDKKAELAKELLEDVSPRELNLIVSQILSRMQIADFFGLTTFLAELNLLHPRKVEN